MKWTFVSLSALLGMVAFVLPAMQGARAGAVVEHDFIGAESCRSCHQEQFDRWAAGPHARALASLSERDRQDKRCQQCHTMVPDDGDPALQGVQCEACHGPGRYYAKEWVMRDSELRQHLLLAKPDEKTCARCHTESAPSLTPFVYEEKLEKIRHWDK